MQLICLVLILILIAIQGAEATLPLTVREPWRQEVEGLFRC